VTLVLPNGVSQIKVGDLTSAICAEFTQNEFLVYRPRIDATEKYIKALSLSKAKLIPWAHVTPSPRHLRILADTRSVVGLIALGNRQALSWVDHPIAKKTIVIQNGQYPAILKSDVTLKTNITYLGALVPQKGFHVLAEAWPRLSLDFPNLRLQVIGSGNLYDKNVQLGQLEVATQSYEAKILRALGESSKTVSFLGKISAAKKAEIIASTFIGIANPTGLTENCPASALDFQAAGVPVIAGKKYGMIDTVLNGTTGILVRNKRGLEKSITWLIENDRMRNEFSKNAIEYVNTNFNFDFIVNQWADFLMCGQKQGASKKLNKITSISLSEKFSILNSFYFRKILFREPPISLVEVKAATKTKLRMLQKMVHLKKQI